MDITVANLPLVGGHPAIDLINTVEPRAPRPEKEHLTDPAALLTWFRRSGLIDGAERDRVATHWSAHPGAGARTLAAVLEIREALYAAVCAAAPPPEESDPIPDAWDVLVPRWTAAAGRSTVRSTPDGPGLARVATGDDPAHLLVDRAAMAAMDLLTTADPGRLRHCPTTGGGCGWVFIDRSRNGSRRWCQMADCGTRVKAERLTERRRAARAAQRSGAGR